MTEIATTPLEELRQEFAKTLAPARLFKRFPARGGRLAGEYRPCGKEEARAAAENQDDEYLLVACLVAVYIADPSHALANEKGLVPLGAWAGTPQEDPLRFDHRLAEVLGLPKGTPAQIALKLFDDNDLRLAEQAGEVAQWSLDTEETAYTDFA